MDQTTATSTYTENAVKFGHVVPEICVQTDIQTCRHAHCNIPLPYREEIITGQMDCGYVKVG